MFIPDGIDIMRKKARRSYWIGVIISSLSQVPCLISFWETGIYWYIFGICAFHFTAWFFIYRMWSKIDRRYESYLINNIYDS